ncbi:MAG: TonB-dependent receptor, partial [Haliscomenobacter sp.]|nr:TonB-dependent receptor [Haliscomenobacter sp.]
MLFDGFTVYHVDHLFGFFSAFNANAVKDVQLFKGGFESKYGGRISSVVDLTGKDGNSEALNIGVGLSLLSVNAFAETPFAAGKGSVLVAARRSFQSNFYNNIFEAFTRNSTRPVNSPPVFAGRRGLPQQDVQPNTYFYDLNAKVSFRPNPSELISLSFYNGQDDLDNTRSADNRGFQGPAGQPGPNFNFVRESTDLTQWGNWGSSLAWSKRFSGRWYANANLSYSNYYSERERGDKTTITRSDSLVVQNNGSRENNDLRDVTLKLDNEFKINSRNQLEFGLQTSYQDVDYSYFLNDTV